MPLVLIPFSFLLSYNILHMFYPAAFLFQLNDIWLSGLNSVSFYWQHWKYVFFNSSKLLLVLLNINPKKLLRKHTARATFLSEAPASPCLRAAYVWYAKGVWNSLAAFEDETPGFIFKWRIWLPVEVKDSSRAAGLYGSTLTTGRDRRCVFICLLVRMAMLVWPAFIDWVVL